MEQTEKSKSSRALPAALFTVFLDAIGVAILIPVFVALVVGEHRVIPDTWTMKQGLIMVGWLSGLYSICTFFAAPVLGQLSDKHGRKIVLAISWRNMDNTSTRFVGNKICRINCVNFFAAFFILRPS